MVTFKHVSGRTVTAEPGTKRYDIFNRSKKWTPVAAPAPAAAKTPAQDGDAPGLEAHSAADLREMAKALGITGYSSMNKGELAQAIAEHQAETE